MKKILIALMLLLSCGHFVYAQTNDTEPVVKADYIIVGDFIYTLYQDQHAEMRGLSNSLEGDIVVPASIEYEDTKYNVTKVLSMTDIYDYDADSQKYVVREEYISSSSETTDYSQVTSITFENGIESVYDRGSFAWYWHCKEVRIPKSMTYIDPLVYYMRFNRGSGYYGYIQNGLDYLLNDITYSVDEENPVYSSHDGVLYDKDKKTLLRCPKNKEGVFVVPDGVEKLDRFAFFYCCFITEIKLPASIRVLGDDGGDEYYLQGRLFNSCYSLEKINIPEGVERIESESFSSCSSLQSLTLPNSLKYFNSRALRHCLKFKYIDWQDCELETLELSNGCTLPVVSLPKKIRNITCTNRDGGKAEGFTLFYPNFPGDIPETFVLPSSIKTFEPARLFGENTVQSSSTEICPLNKLYVLFGNVPMDISEDFFGYYSVLVNKQTQEQFPQTWANQCTLYVPENLVDAYKSHAVWGKFPNIVGVEVIREIEPIEEEIVIAFNNEDYIVDDTPIDLNNTVINDMYISIDNTSDASNPDGFYNPDEQCIVINKATSEEAMQTVVASELGSNDFVNNYTGMVIEVNGKGSVKINAQTVGKNKLAVKIGNEETKAYTQTTKDDVNVNYDVTDNTYVYLYAADNDDQKLKLSMGATSDDAVKVYSITVSPNVTAIEKVVSTTSASAFVKIYTIDGKRISQLQKGVNILRMSDGTTKKVVK